MKGSDVFDDDIHLVAGFQPVLLILGITVHNTLGCSGEDHIADETRYFLMTRPVKPRQAAPKDEFSTSPLHLIFDIDRKDIITKPRIQRMEVIDADEIV